MQGLMRTRNNMTVSKETIKDMMSAKKEQDFDLQVASIHSDGSRNTKHRTSDMLRRDSKLSSEASHNISSHLTSSIKVNRLASSQVGLAYGMLDTHR